MNWLQKNKKWIQLLSFIFILSLLFPKLKFISVDIIVDLGLSSIPLAILAFLIIYVLKAIVMVIPVTVLYIAAGIVFPTEWAITITYCLLFLELTIGYFRGKKLGAGKVDTLLKNNKRVAQFIENREDSLPSLCFISRLLPLPVDVFSMFFGTVNMPYGKYIFVSLLGLSPTMIPFVIASSSISHPLSLSFLLPFGISSAFTIFVFIIFNLIIKKKNSA